MSDYLSRLGTAADIRRTRYGNLPLWAAEELNRLSRELDKAERLLSADPEDSNTWLEPYASVPRPIGRPRHIRHRFSNGLVGTIQWEQDQDRAPFSLPVMDVMISGGYPVVIFDGAANVVRIRLEPDR